MESSSGCPGPTLWRRRIQRAGELAARPATATEPLRFYEKVLHFQAGVAEQFRSMDQPTVQLRERIDFNTILWNLPKILVLVSEHGPTGLADQARVLTQLGKSDWENILEHAIAGQQEDPVEDFFCRACIQPIAERLQVEILLDRNYLKSTCPACGGLPQFAILRPEGEGASRSLVCSFCLREWNFRRIVCPSCGEENKEKLPRFSAAEYGHVSVDACDSCMRYMKSVDMTVDGHAEPLVDEAATAALDLWAVDRGYTKIMRNLVGF
jgi:FdhE protein